MTNTRQAEEQAEAPQEAQPSNDQGADSTRLGEAFRHELEQVIQPVLETIRSQRRESEGAPEGNGQEAPASGEQEEAFPEPSEPPVLTVTVKGRRAEHVMDMALDALLEGLFSSDLRDAVQQHSARTLKAMVTAGRKGLPSGQSLSEEQEELERGLDETLEGMFSEEARARMRQRGQAVIASALSWNGPAARADGEKALQELEQERLTAITAFWKQALTTLLKASQQPADEKPASKTRSQSSSNGHESGHDKIPQTVLRSDKRAQDIWKKAYDRAAGKDGQGSGAQKAAYDALKEQYEKKGDRWIKKERQKSS